MDSTWSWSALVAFVMVVQTGLAHAQFRSWLAPGAFFSLIWTALVLLSLVAAPEFRIWPGVLWISLISIAVHLGALLYDRPVTLGSDASRQAARLGLPGILWLTSASAIAGTLGISYLTASIGRPLSDAFTLQGIVEMAPQFSGLRYTDAHYQEPSSFLLVATFTFLGGYLGGFAIALASSWRARLLALTPFIPELMTTVMHGSRTGFAVLSINFAAAYLSARVLRGAAELKLFNMRNLYRAVGAASLLLAFYVGVQTLRMGQLISADVSAVPTDDRELIDYSINAAKTQYIGFVAGFNHWFLEHWDIWQPPTWGIQSFDGPAGWFGYAISRNSEEFSISPDPDFPSTNVSSLFRPLAEDFTLPGLVLIMLALGFAGQLAFRRVYNGRLHFLPLLVAFYQVALYPTAFTFRHTVVDGALIMFSLYILLVVVARYSVSIQHK